MPVAAPTAYAALADLPLTGISAEVIAWFSNGEPQRQLDVANAAIDAVMATRFVMPLTSWGMDLVGVACDIAAYKLVKLRGFQPDGNGDNGELSKAYDNALEWLDKIRKGQITPQNVVDSSTPNPMGNDNAGGGEPFALQPQIVDGTEITILANGSVDSSSTVTAAPAPPKLRGW